MTARYNFLTVALEKDVREDDAEHLINAIKMLRGVRSVEPNVADGVAWMAEERARHDIHQKLFDLLIFPGREKENR